MGRPRVRVKKLGFKSFIRRETSEQGASGKYKFRNRTRSETLHNPNFNLAFWLRVCLYFMLSWVLSASTVFHVHVGWWLLLKCTAVVQSLKFICGCHCTRAKGGLQQCQHAKAAVQRPNCTNLTPETGITGHLWTDCDVTGGQPSWQAGFETFYTNMAGSTISNFWSSPVSSPYQIHAILTSNAY